MYKSAQTLRLNQDGLNVLLEAKGDGSKSILQLCDEQILRKLFPEPNDMAQGNASGILSFLDNLDWNLTSESGAEYKYYKAELPIQTGKFGTRVRNFFARLFQPADSLMDLEEVSFSATLIEPATPRIITRMSKVDCLVMVQETKEAYEEITRPYIQLVLGGGKSIAWLINVIEGKKEVERVLFQNDNFLLNVDTKWRSHPDLVKTPRSEWKGHAATADLYCLAILKERGVASLRDLRAKHVPVLKDIMEQGSATIAKVYGVPKEELRMYVHYLPQFYHFHVHFTRLFNTYGCSCERAHLLQSVIDNLERDPLYYAEANLHYVVSNKHSLVKPLSKHSNSKRKSLIR